ncbi:hypothetical protein EJB05_28214, partial [Eragrostis curvula]
MSNIIYIEEWNKLLRHKTVWLCSKRMFTLLLCLYVKVKRSWSMSNSHVVASSSRLFPHVHQMWNNNDENEQNLRYLSQAYAHYWPGIWRAEEI